MHAFDLTETFIAVVDCSSFVQAAKQLDVAPSVVTRRINLLEQELKTQLLIRTTRRLSLTRAGESYYREMQPLVEHWYSVCELVQADQQSLSGKLSVAVSVYLSRLLQPTILTFIKQNPAVDLHYFQVQSQVDCLRDQIDVVIGPNHLIADTEGLIARPIGTTMSQLYASPEYIERHGIPNSLVALKDQRVIAWKRRDQSKPVWQMHGSRLHLTAQLIFNDWEMAIAAACAGEGVLLIPTPMVHSQVESGTLLPVLRDYKTTPTQLNLYYAKRQFTSRIIQTFVECILQSSIKKYYPE